MEIFDKLTYGRNYTRFLGELAKIKPGTELILYTPKKSNASIPSGRAIERKRTVVSHHNGFCRTRKANGLIDSYRYSEIAKYMHKPTDVAIQKEGLDDEE